MSNGLRRGNLDRVGLDFRDLKDLKDFKDLRVG